MKHFGEKVQGKVERVEKINKNHLYIEYSYQVGIRKYAGQCFYNSNTRYKQEEIGKLISRIKQKQFYPVYYKLKHPEKSVCFVTSEELWLNKKLFIALLTGWIIWGLGYLQAWIWDKNRI